MSGAGFRYSADISLYSAHTDTIDEPRLQFVPKVHIIYNTCNTQYIIYTPGNIKESVNSDAENRNALWSSFATLRD